MQLLLLIICVTEGWGVTSVCSDVVGVGGDALAPPASPASAARRPLRDAPPRHQDTGQMLWDFYDDKPWPNPVRRQNNPNYMFKTTKRIYTLGSSEDERYGKTMLYWRGPSPEPPGGYWEPYVYDPTAGYEPYWIDGEWLIDSAHLTTTTTTATATATTKKPPRCNIECPEAFKKFGPVCATDPNLGTLQSFPTYCGVMRKSCYSGKELTVSYRGNCAKPDTKWLLYHFRHDIRPEEQWNKANHQLLLWFRRSPTTLTWTHYSTKPTSSQPQP